MTPELLTLVGRKFAALELRHDFHSLLLTLEFEITAAPADALEMRIELITRIGKELARLRPTDTVAYHLGQLQILLPGCQTSDAGRVSTEFRTLIADVFGDDVSHTLKISMLPVSQAFAAETQRS